MGLDEIELSPKQLNQQEKTSLDPLELREAKFDPRDSIPWIEDKVPQDVKKMSLYVL